MPPAIATAMPHTTPRKPPPAPSRTNPPPPMPPFPRRPARCRPTSAAWPKSPRARPIAPGRGSDPEHDGWLKSFSNGVGSEATSRGAYLTGSWYDGKYGTSVRLTGLDADNSNAFDRAIVMHPAWYAAPDMLSKWGKLGRSEGCFAMAPEQFNEALWRLAGGRLLYADRIGEV